MPTASLCLVCHVVGAAHGPHRSRSFFRTTARAPQLQSGVCGVVAALMAALSGAEIGIGEDRRPCSHLSMVRFGLSMPHMRVSNSANSD